MKRAKCIYCGKKRSEDKLTPAYFRTQKQLKDKRKGEVVMRCKQPNCWEVAEIKTEIVYGKPRLFPSIIDF